VKKRHTTEMMERAEYLHCCRGYCLRTVAELTGVSSRVLKRWSVWVGRKGGGVRPGADLNKIEYHLPASKASRKKPGRAGRRTSHCRPRHGVACAEGRRGRQRGGGVVAFTGYSEQYRKRSGCRRSTRIGMPLCGETPGRRPLADEHIRRQGIERSDRVGGDAQKQGTTREARRAFG